jgi:hypothetical protein
MSNELTPTTNYISYYCIYYASRGDGTDEEATTRRRRNDGSRGYYRYPVLETHNCPAPQEHQCRGKRHPQAGPKRVPCKWHSH